MFCTETISLPASSPASAAACYPGEFHVKWDIQYNSPVSFSNTLRIIVTLFRFACSDTCHMLRAADSSDPPVHYVICNQSLVCSQRYCSLCFLSWKKKKRLARRIFMWVVKWTNKLICWLLHITFLFHGFCATYFPQLKTAHYAAGVFHKRS
jgi:hypothetical protein